MIGPDFDAPRRSAMLASMAALATLTGCVVVPANDYYGYETDIVTVAPPPPRYEAIGVAPVAGQVWLGGYWGWAGRRHVWVGGRWAAPRPGYYWQPHAWVRAGGGWRLRAGHWGRR